MNETLKAAGHIGAELGAAIAENERLRGLLREAFDSLCDGLEEGPMESESSLADRALAFRITAALSLQTEPAPAQNELIPRNQAVAEAFREGVEWQRTRPAQTEQQPEQSGLVESLRKDSERLDFIIGERCLVEEIEGSYWLSWPDLNEEQIISCETPRQAIDAARAALSATPSPAMDAKED